MQLTPDAGVDYSSRSGGNENRPPKRNDWVRFTDAAGPSSTMSGIPEGGMDDMWPTTYDKRAKRMLNGSHSDGMIQQSVDATALSSPPRAI